MSLAGWRDGVLTSIENLIDAGFHGRERNSGPLAFVALFILAWTAFQIVAFSSIGLHPDLTELFGWSRHPAAGYYKHPPLGALMTAAWFSVFPVRDWAYQLLAMTNAGAALLFTDLIARRYVSGGKRLTVLLLLLCMPFLQFHGQRFGANQVLLATWPLATYCFLRAFNTRDAFWSLAAGAAAALAMLGKYYSVFLIGGLILAVLSHPARWSYLRSLSPWLTVAAGFIVLAPHLRWLVETGYQPIVYAFSIHSSPSALKEFINAPRFLAVCAGYAALPVVIYWLLARPDRATVMDTIWPADPERRMLVVALAGFFLLPALSVFVFGVMLSSLWTMPAYFLLPIVLLSPPSVVLARRPVAIFAVAMLAFTFIAVVGIAPVLAVRNFTGNDEGDRAYLADLGRAVTNAWHDRLHRPLPIVLGATHLADGTGFYSPDHPDSAPDSVIAVAPWITPERLAREGYAAVCAAGDNDCVGRAERARGTQAAPADRVIVDITPYFFGRSRAPARFTVLIFPPQSRQ